MHRHKKRGRGRKVWSSGDTYIQNMSVSNTYVQVQQSSYGNAGHAHRKRHHKRKERDSVDWGPTLACMGVVDGSRYSAGDLVAGNAKVLGHCATNAVESACDIVGGCCKIAWYCGEAAWGLGKGLVGLFR